MLDQFETGWGGGMIVSAPAGSEPRIRGDHVHSAGPAPGACSFRMTSRRGAMTA
jgi:hypothetical protein